MNDTNLSSNHEWPNPLGPDAIAGLAGAVVELIAPHTEADPAALLLQLLAGFGCMVGDGAYAVADGARHPARLNVVLVGATSKGRKGTSWAQVKRLLALADPDWTKERLANGLSSGEGLIQEVRDAHNKDEGVADKRLLVQEGEFGRVLVAAGRKDCTLSMILRSAWDGDQLRTMTKTSPLRATGAHVSVVGHVTLVELRRLLSACDVGNGLVNRFLWAMVRRSKLLPEGGSVPEVELSRLGAALSEVATKARDCGELRRNASAKDLWRNVYGELSEGRPGLLGSATDRAEAQVLRLSVGYAILDGAAEIAEGHLRSALALWEYCVESAEYIFRDAIGDRVADTIMALLRDAGPRGLTRTEVRDGLGRHQSSAELGAALDLLLASGLARVVEERGKGRTSSRYFAELRLKRGKRFKGGHTAHNALKAQGAGSDGALVNGQTVQAGRVIHRA